MRSSRTVRPVKAGLLASFLAVALLVAFGGSAHAASPGWKLLALTGPTHLPPKQSETQRVTIEAEGGTFSLKEQTAAGEGTFTSHIGVAEVAAGSNTAHVFLLAQPYAVGERIVAAAFPVGTTITGVSGPPEEPTLELSNPATSSESFEFFETSSNVVTGVTASAGEFHPGDEIDAEVLPPGTTVTTVGSGTLTLSDFPTFGGESVPLFASETTAPIAFDASATAVQSAFDALPGFPPGSVTVSGGPSGSAATPLFVSFGGPFANEDVGELEVGAAGLTGGHPAARVFAVVPGGPGTGEIAVLPVNVGGGPTNGEPMTIRVGPLPPGIVTSGPAEDPNETLGIWSCLGKAGESTVVCTATAQADGLRPVGSIVVPIEVDQPLAGSSTVPVTIEGGGAPAVSYPLSIVVSNQPAPFGVQAFWAGAFDADGNPETRAGAHPYSAQTFFELNTVRGTTGKIVPAGDAKEVKVDLPPGFLGNPLTTKRCPQALVAENNPPGLPQAPLCNSEEMSVGHVKPALGIFGTEASGTGSRVFNDVPPRGYAAEFTTLIGAPLQSLLGSVRASEDAA